MKILIAYASAGVGHYRAAEAIYNYLKVNYNKLDIKIVDILDYTNFLFKYLYTWGYSFIVTRLAFLWNLAYQITYNKNLRILNKNIYFITNRLNTQKFKQFLLSYNPHIIVTTHFLPSEVASFLKKKNKINSRLITVITDFNIHPFWVMDSVDWYIVGSDVTLEELNSFGIVKDKIKTLGIPVDLKFTKKINKEMLYEKLGIQKDKFTVLVVTAAFGLGPIEKIVDLLQKEIQLLVVCGKNNKLYGKLVNKDFPLVKIFGFVNNMEELIAVSDIIITKPGGSTICESLAMDKPMIFISAIYGQETKNARILENYGVGISLTNLTAIRDTVLKFKNNPDRLNSIREKIKKIKKPYAAKEICEWFLPK